MTISFNDYNQLEEGDRLICVFGSPTHMGTNFSKGTVYEVKDHDGIYVTDDKGVRWRTHGIFEQYLSLDLDHFKRTDIPLPYVGKTKDVSKQTHYVNNGIEPIEIMRQNFTQAEFRGFLAGNVQKYLSRHKAKNGLEDLQKAKVYLEWLIEDWEKRSK